MTDTLDALIEAVKIKPKKGRPPGQQGTVNRKIQYACDNCGATVDQSFLNARQVSFINLKTRKNRRSRTINWICNTCMLTHPDYNRPIRTASPGMRDIHAQT